MLMVLSDEVGETVNGTVRVGDLSIADGDGYRLLVIFPNRSRHGEDRS